MFVILVKALLTTLSKPTPLHRTFIKIVCPIIFFTFLFSHLDSRAYTQTLENPLENEAIAKGTHLTYPTVNYGEGTQAELIKLGEYLTRAGNCISCHTDSLNGGKPFAGDLPMKTPFGTFYTPNITPDKATGIGKWTREDFIRSMRDGKAPDGSNYFPVFPYIYFN